MAKKSTYKTTNFLESFGEFFGNKWHHLKKDEVLFSPGEDPHFYIVASGSLNVFRITPLGEKKEVGRAYVGGFLGEWVLFGRNIKDTKAVACTKNTSVIPLTKEDIDVFAIAHPDKIALLYRYLIEITSMRLSETGKELALTYEMSEQINHLANMGAVGFKQIVDYIASTLQVGYIIYIEKHPLVHDLLVYKYSSKFPSVRPINQIVDGEFNIKSAEGVITPTETIIGTSDRDTLYLLPLKTSDQLKGFLLIGMKDHGDLDDADLRILRNTSSLLASIIENQQSQSIKNTTARAEISF